MKTLTKCFNNIICNRNLQWNYYGNR